MEVQSWGVGAEIRAMPLPARERADVSAHGGLQRQGGLSYRFQRAHGPADPGSESPKLRHDTRCV